MEDPLPNQGDFQVNKLLNALNSVKFAKFAPFNLLAIAMMFGKLHENWVHAQPVYIGLSYVHTPTYSEG